jgi:hypothetical protein
MTRLGRAIESVIIVDNSPASYLFQPENAIPCESFIENPADRELLEMVPFLESIAGVPVRCAWKGLCVCRVVCVHGGRGGVGARVSACQVCPRVPSPRWMWTWACP